jgi:hypothetical protein
MTEAMAAALPNARTALVAGGHRINPAREVLAFVEEVLERRWLSARNVLAHAP